MKSKKLKKKSQQKSKPIGLYFLLASTIIVVPLIFSSNTLDPNLAPRLLALGIILLVLAIFNLSMSKRERPRFDFLKLIIFPVFGLYLIWSVFSLTQAINPAEGLFDIFKTLVSIALLIFAVQFFIQNENAISLLTKFVIISSFLATGIGFYQYFGTVPGHSKFELFAALYKVKGLMGHKNQYAVSIYLMLPFVLFGVINFEKKWRWLSLISVSLLLINIAILQTRSVWIATILFILSFILLWLVFSSRKSFSINKVFLKKALLVFTVIFIALSASIIIFQKSGASNLLKYQVSSIFDLGSDNNQGRLKMWESTLQLSEDNLFFGVGAGNWKISVLPYYNLNYGSKYQNWRRPHNDFLWVLSEKGIIGLILYLLLFLAIAFYGFKILLNEKDKGKRIFASLMVSGIGGYLIISFFTFPMERINHQVYIMLMMAGIISIYFRKAQTPKKANSKFYFRYHIFASLLLIMAIIYASIAFRSEIYCKKIFQAKETNDWKKMIVNSDIAFSSFTTLDPFSMPIHLYKGVAKMKLKKNKEAYKEFQIALKYFPTQISILNNLGTVSSILGDNEKAEMYFKQATELFPQYDVSLLNLVKIYYKNKEYKKSYLALLRYSTKNPKSDIINLKKELERRINKPKKGLE